MLDSSQRDFRLKRITKWAALAFTGCVSLSCLSACSSEPSKPAATVETEKKPAAPAIPQEFQDVAKTMLGTDSEVLLYGDLSKNGKDEILAANVVPNTPKSVVAGTVVTRVVIAEKSAEGKWAEVFRADEHLKNPKGYLGLTPLQGVTGWKLQHEQSPDKGLTLYLTPLKSGSSERTLPIAVSYNTKTGRYQSMDLSYQHFLLEAPSLETARSAVR